VDALAFALGSAAVEDVPSRLLDVEAVRYERAHFIQQASRFLAVTPHDDSGKQKATQTQKCSVVAHPDASVSNNSTLIVTPAPKKCFDDTTRGSF
jgi:hypothetical protein